MAKLIHFEKLDMNFLLSARPPDNPKDSADDSTREGVWLCTPDELEKPVLSSGQECMPLSTRKPFQEGTPVRLDKTAWSYTNNGAGQDP